MKHRQSALLISIAFFISVTNNAVTQNRTLRSNPSLQPGDVAPVFTLKTLDGKEEVNIQALVGQRPIILIFGSYT